jgi:hypothetical protein
VLIGVMLRNQGDFTIVANKNQRRNMELGD